MLLCCARQSQGISKSLGPPRCTARYAGFRAVADERNGSATALMQSLKHCKVLHGHDNLTGSPISPTPERAHYRTDKPDLPFAHWNPHVSPFLRRGKRATLARKKMGRKRFKASFDPKIFLAKVGEGKTISKYRKDQIVFSQGQVADAVFYIQQGKIKLTVVSEQGKEAVVDAGVSTLPRKQRSVMKRFYARRVMARTSRAAVPSTYWEMAITIAAVMSLRRGTINADPQPIGKSFRSVCKLLPQQCHRWPWRVRHGRGKLQLIRGHHRQKADR
jgi:CRP-like cAMP-binding protein